MKIFCFILFYAYYMSSLAQPDYFSHKIDYNNLWSSSRDVVEIDSFYFICGGTGSPWTNDTGQVFKLNKFNLENEIHHLAYFEVGTTRFIEKKVNGNNETLVVGGRYFNGDFINENVEIFLVELDTETLDTIQYKTFDLLDRGDWPKKLIPTSDGGYAITGYSFITGETQYMFILKLDSLWNQQFFKLYQAAPNRNHFANDIIETPDKGFIVVGHKSGTDITKKDAIFLKTDSLGNIIYWKIHAPEGNEKALFPANIKRKENGNFIVTGNKTYVVTGFAENQKLWITEVNSEGEILSSNDYYSHRGTSWFSLQKLSDGNFLGGGYERQNYQTIDDTLETPQLGIVSKISTQGDLIWHRQYRNNPLNRHYDRFRNVIPTSDGGILCVGTTWGDSLTRQDVWVVKLDSFGCLEPGCHIIDNVKEPRLLENDLSVFPNPTDGVVQVQLDNNDDWIKQIQVISLNGQLLEDIQFFPNQKAREFELNLGQLSEGMYLVRVRTEKGIGIRKIIKG